MKRFLFQRSVENAGGTQTFYVDAETQEEAESIARDEGGEFYSEEVEVTALGEPEFCGETSLDDYGDEDQPTRPAPPSTPPPRKEPDMTEDTKPATPAEAEELAKRAVSDYLNACRMNSESQIGNYLMKLASVAGVLMAQAEGSAEAALRLEGTARFLLKTMPKKPAKIVRMQ